MTYNTDTIQILSVPALPAALGRRCMRLTLLGRIRVRIRIRPTYLVLVVPNLGYHLFLP